MGSRSVKKAKPQKFVTMELFQEWCQLNTDFIAAVDASLNKVDTDINQMKEQGVKDFGLIADTINQITNNVVKLQRIIDDPVVIHTGQVSEEMLNNLKNSEPQPVTFNSPPPKESQWRNAEERCAHTLKAVREALALMQGIEYIVSNTNFVVCVRCQGKWRRINVGFNGTKHCAMDFFRRNDRHEYKEFSNTTQAAAGIVAVVMYYATR